MASLFTNKGSKWIYLSYIGKDGKWHKANTGYKNGNLGEERQAQRLADAKSLEEKLQTRTDQSGRFDEWAAVWIHTKYGDSKSGKHYHIRLRNVMAYLSEIGVEHPASLTRSNVSGYLSWRQKEGKSRNTAIGEIQLLSMVLDEAVARGYCGSNVAKGLRFRHDKPKDKSAWTDAEIARVDATLEQTDRYGWMRTTFLLGRYQALRIRQCAVPLECIDLDRGMIHYPNEIVKMAKGFSQPISPKFLPTLRELVGHRRATGHRTLCDVPVLCSVEWRQFLDTLGLHHLSHHGLRVSWISRAALSGVPEIVARQFANHSSSIVHQIYQRASVENVASFLKNL
jgi:hypothetical protein